MSRRRVAALLLTLAALLIVAAPTAVAQDEDSVVVSLRAQTPFVTTREPELDAEILARNDGNEPLQNLALRATIWSQVLSIGAYEASLEGDPPGGTIVGAHAQPFDGSLEPGQTRRFHIQLRVQGDGISTVQSYVYPLKLELLSGATPRATIRTATIVIVHEPLHPLVTSTRLTLAAPLSMGVDGAFHGDALANAVRPEGRLGAAAGAVLSEIRSKHPSAMDVVVSPVLLLQLERMRDGYTVVDDGATRRVEAGEGGAGGAARMIADLRAIARSGIVQISAWPFGAATIPSLLDHLSRDVPEQISRGRQAVNRVVGERASASVMYPPRSAITQESIDALAASGARVLLLDAAAVPAELQRRGFSPPAARALPSTIGVGGEPIAAIVPDEGVQRLLTSETAQANPVLAAQQALAELAAVWLEQPGIERSIAVAVPDDPAPSPGLAPAIVRRIAAAPFLRAATATDLADRFPPPAEPSAFAQLDARTFSATYASALKHTRRLIDSYRSTLVQPDPTPNDLKELLLLLEGAQFLENEAAGESAIGVVDDHVERFLGQIRPVANHLVTLTSKNGQIPVQILNDTGQPVEVDVKLISPHLTVGGGQTKQVTLTRASSSITFDVGLKTTGEFPVQVQLLAPSGRPISDITIAVRSTAYSSIALIITIGAAIALLALWGRRFLPSRRATT